MNRLKILNSVKIDSLSLEIKKTHYCGSFLAQFFYIWKFIFLKSMTTYIALLIQYKAFCHNPMYNLYYCIHDIVYTQLL